uniref:RING-type domain-containing protein n=1 Tax=Alexandrium monilatum TaxID=311494 RepID=A0A6T1A1F9_9DINO|mmetsp:Transcript_92302/g.275339  ORF Transcript_92302/g.275339 Transcript_92302/m.275339 type:complete len:332 (-) Transcript_92302:136-1131(-)
MVLPPTSDAAANGGHVALVPVPEERVEELVQNGHLRRDALRQVTRENMEAEIREGLSDTLQSGSMPGCARACGRLCGVLIIVLLLLLTIFCISVGVCCCAMHLRGWYLTLWLVGCGQQGELRAWLVLYQSLSLTEACCGTYARSRSQELVEWLDSRFRPGCTRATAFFCTMLSSALKGFWCVHVQSVVARSPAEEGCGEPLPRFMHWYSCVLLLQLLVVEPCARLGMSLVLWAATTGLLQTSRGAKPGMLESLQVVEYSAELFADANDPADNRPQRECCFCLEEYDGSTPIVRTPCQHFMHRECLARWLQTSHFCPICRGDLEDLQQSRLP